MPEMPLLKQGWNFEVGRRIRIFLKVEAGIGRGARAGLVHTGTQKPDVGEQLVVKDREIARLRAELVTRSGDGAPINAIRPENIVWIFGVARTGSSWLASMMRDIEGNAMWYEPYVGDVFGYAFYIRAPDWQREREEFILGDRYREIWLSSIRKLVLDSATARFPDLTDGGYLTIKEPNGSVGAPLLMEALPESRMVLLTRDPRDVVASLLYANRKGSWGSKQAGHNGSEDSLADSDPDRFVRQRASMYLASLGKAKEAYEAHKGYRVAVRYEDLRYKTFEELKRIHSTLGIPVDEKQLRWVIEKYAWENIPDEKKGTDKRLRKAIPGGWREDLTPEQARVVEEITAPLLREFYPG